MLRTRLILRSLSVFTTFALLLYAAATVASHSGFSLTDDCQENMWTVSSFLDFAAGTALDGGSNTLISAAGDVRLINVCDLNNDGFLDVVLPNSHDNNQQIDLFIYWDIENYHVRSRTTLPTDGGVAQAIADLNSDGYPDLVVANSFNGVKTNLLSYVYWGGQSGFDVNRRSELPTMGAEGVAAGDLDQDGHLDLVFANNGRSYGGHITGPNRSYVYWGSPQGFSAGNMLALPTAVASDAKLADLNADGRMEIVFANEGSQKGDGGVLIYWGGDGRRYSEEKITRLPGERSSAIELADLNGDGNLEIVVANRYRPLLLRSESVEMDTDVESEAIDSSIYWGSSNGYSEPHRTGLPTVAASDVAAGDLNGDGYLDLVFANGPSRSGHSASAGENGTYVYWGGLNGYDTGRRSILPSLNATDCLIDDLNSDGYPDLALANENDGRSFNTRSYVYWGSPDGLSETLRLELPTAGAASVGAADFNRNGRKELVFINRVDGASGEPVPAYIYWGNEKGEYLGERRQSLLHPYGSPGEGYAAGDVNGDGFVDLFLGGPESAIYWGSRGGFWADNKTVIAPRMVFSGRFADFNRDGYLDIVLSEYAAGGETSLYWGGPTGFTSNNRFVFRVDGVRFHSVADLDGNGYLDVVFPTLRNKTIIFWNSAQGFKEARSSALRSGVGIATEVADLNVDGFLDLIVCNMRSPEGNFQGNTLIYWGGNEGFAEQRRLVLPSVGNEDAAVADLNHDGYLDLVLSSYHAGETRSHPSYVYWNAAGTFDPARVTLLPTDSGSGILISDFNHDGHPDILFACHSKEGAHRTDSFLYWGSSQGYGPEQRSRIFGLGPHLFTVSDIGNVYNRGDRYEYVSAAFDGGSGARFKTLTWEGETPFATRIEFQIRSASSQQALKTAEWLGPSGPDTFYRHRQCILPGLGQDGRWVQFKATLVSPNGANSPVLRRVSIAYCSPARSSKRK